MLASPRDALYNSQALGSAYNAHMVAQILVPVPAAAAATTAVPVVPATTIITPVAAATAAAVTAAGKLLVCLCLLSVGPAHS